MSSRARIPLFLAPVCLASLASAQAPCGAAETPCGLPGVTLVVTPACALPGEEVQVSVRNDSSETITLPTGCVYLSVSQGATCTGAVAFSPGCPFVLVPLTPGTSFTLPWAQNDDLGNQVPPGTYSFAVWYWDAAFASLIQCCAEVTIASTCPRASAVPRNGSGLNPPTLRNVQPPRLGSTWIAELDCAGHAPGQAYLFVHDAPSAGTFHRYGELLVGGRHLFGLQQVHAGTSARFSVPVPPLLALCGRRAYAQALVGGAPRPQLSNALDLLLWD
ncbi:MAG TPA: hypothetical protein VF530_09065 [Planctomycetota bacterium]